MAHRIAGRFRDRGESVEDLRQVAALGLVKAIDRFDPERGAFESYAVPTITGEVKRHFRDRTWALRVPRRVQELRNRVRVARRDLTERPGSRAPSVAGIAGHTGLTEAEVTTGLEALDSYRTLSLDADPAGEGSTLTDSLGAPDPAYSVVIDASSRTSPRAASPPASASPRCTSPASRTTSAPESEPKPRTPAPTGPSSGRGGRHFFAASTFTGTPRGRARPETASSRRWRWRRTRSVTRP